MRVSNRRPLGLKWEQAGLNEGISDASMKLRVVH